MPDSEIVVYKRGEIQKKIDPTILQFVMLDDIEVALTKLNEHFKKEEFQGYEDFEILLCTEIEGAIWPIPPWITAFFLNKGPDKAYVNINHRGKWIELENGESTRCDHAGADMRIGLVLYKCDPGETATVTALGKY